MKVVSVFILASVAFLTGCGKEEKNEAIRLAKVLKTKQADYAKANALEQELVDNARAWSGGITAKGAGKGADLEKHTLVANELARSAVAVSTELSTVRQAVAAESLNSEFTQGVKNELVDQIAKRQRMLQDMRALLLKSAPQFDQYRLDKSFAGDSYPGEISQLDTMLQVYKAPANVLETALNNLKENYKLKDGEY